MELIRKKGKQHDNVDVTFRIVSQHTKIGRLVVTYQSVCSYLLFIVMGYAAVNLKLLQEVEIHVLSNLDRHQHAVNDAWVGNCQISFSIQLINTIRRAQVIILFIIKSMFTLVFCLQTIKQNEPPHSDAFLGQRLLSLTLHGRSTAFYCAITTVQYQPYKYSRILYGHVVGMVRCDWPFTIGYIIIQYITSLAFSPQSIKLNMMYQVSTGLRCISG